MRNRTMAIARRAAAVATLALASTAAHALPSSAVFAYTGQPGAVTDVRLELATNTGVYTINSVLRGWVKPDGDNNGASGTNNYITGLCGSDDSCLGSDSDHRTWFTFSLVTTAFSSISSATLLLDVPSPGGGDQGVYVSPLGNPTYTVWDVTQPVGNFTAGTAGVNEFIDLGTGTSYGARMYTLADQGTTTSIALNATAVAYLNGNLQNTVILGGAVTPIPTRALPTATAVPTNSPAALALVAALLAAAGWAGLRRRNRT